MSESVFLVWDGEYEHVAAIYTSAKDAEAHVAQLGGEIEVMEVRTGLPTIRPYFHAMGQVGNAAATVDIEPTVEQRGLTDGVIGDEEGVSLCPGSEWMIGSAQTEPSIWLSAFAMDADEALRRCQGKYDELRARRARDGVLSPESEV